MQVRKFMHKTFVNYPKIAKFMKVFTSERFPLYGNSVPNKDCRDRMIVTLQ